MTVMSFIKKNYRGWVSKAPRSETECTKQAMESPIPTPGKNCIAGYSHIVLSLSCVCKFISDVGMHIILRLLLVLYIFYCTYGNYPFYPKSFQTAHFAFLKSCSAGKSLCPKVSLLMFVKVSSLRGVYARDF